MVHEYSQAALGVLSPSRPFIGLLTVTILRRITITAPCNSNLLTGYSNSRPTVVDSTFFVRSCWPSNDPELISIRSSIYCALYDVVWLDLPSDIQQVNDCRHAAKTGKPRVRSKKLRQMTGDALKDKNNGERILDHS